MVTGIRAHWKKSFPGTRSGFIRATDFSATLPLEAESRVLSEPGERRQPYGRDVRKKWTVEWRDYEHGYAVRYEPTVGKYGKHTVVRDPSGTMTLEEAREEVRRGRQRIRGIVYDPRSP